MTKYKLTEETTERDVINLLSEVKQMIEKKCAVKTVKQTASGIPLVNKEWENKRDEELYSALGKSIYLLRARHFKK